MNWKSFLQVAVDFLSKESLGGEGFSVGETPCKPHFEKLMWYPL